MFHHKKVIFEGDLQGIQEVLLPIMLCKVKTYGGKTYTNDFPLDG